MGFQLPRVAKAKKLLQRSFSSSSQFSISSAALLTGVPKGYFAVYVGDDSEAMKRFLVPLLFLNEPLFQELLSQSEEEFGFNHPMGCLTIPCRQDIFLDLVSHLNSSL